MADDIYVGRGIVIGMCKEGTRFGATFVTGRSDSSKARNYVTTKGRVATEPTDPELLEQGDPELLLYDAMITLDEKTYGFGNGKQTETALIHKHLGGGIASAHKQWSVEPDKYRTARISAVASLDSDYFEMGIIRDVESDPKNAYHVQFQPGEFALITTYDGPNVEPVPPFRGPPTRHQMDIASPTTEQLVHIIQEHMGNPDYHVALAVQILGGELRLKNNF